MRHDCARLKHGLGELDLRTARNDAFVANSEQARSFGSRLLFFAIFAGFVGNAYRAYYDISPELSELKYSYALRTRSFVRFKVTRVREDCMSILVKGTLCTTLALMMFCVHRR